MNILFLTISEINSIYSYGIYSDLMRCFMNKGHNVYISTPIEKRKGLKTFLTVEEDSQILHIRTGNITKCGLLEKAISTLRIEKKIKKGIRKFFKDVKFDLVLYSTPPITFYKVIRYIKNRDNCKTYLMLKDIFPQNAVDLEMLSVKGVKSMIYRSFRKKEKQLYAISDKIGCMSAANVNYILEKNPEVNREMVEICPNCIEVRDLRLKEDEKFEMRRKYQIPNGKVVFVYGGNLGKPQGISFVIDCLRAEKNNDKVFFLIVGSGTEYGKLEQFEKTEHPTNYKLMKQIPKDDYDKMIAACDVGMIFLDHKFTIPNFPSRLLSYMQVGLPVLACTDTNTDVGMVVEEGDFGWWCESNSINGFCEKINEITNDGELRNKGNKGFIFLKSQYGVEKAYDVISNI